MRPSDLLLVFTGAGLGGVARYGVSTMMIQSGQTNLVALLAINIVGSILLGFFVGLWGGRHSGPFTFVGPGLLGGFTTFSAFSVEAVDLWQRGDQGRAALFVGVSVVGSLVGAAIGLIIGQRFHPDSV